MQKNPGAAVGRLRLEVPSAKPRAVRRSDLRVSASNRCDIRASWRDRKPRRMEGALRRHCAGGKQKQSAQQQNPGDNQSPAKRQDISLRIEVRTDRKRTETMNTRREFIHQSSTFTAALALAGAAQSATTAQQDWYD